MHGKETHLLHVGEYLAPRFARDLVFQLVDFGQHPFGPWCPWPRS